MVSFSTPKVGALLNKFFCQEKYFLSRVCTYFFSNILAAVLSAIPLVSTSSKMLELTTENTWRKLHRSHLLFVIFCDDFADLSNQNVIYSPS